MSDTVVALGLLPFLSALRWGIAAKSVVVRIGRPTGIFTPGRFHTLRNDSARANFEPA